VRHSKSSYISEPCTTTMVDVSN